MYTDMPLTTLSFKEVDNTIQPQRLPFVHLPQIGGLFIISNSILIVFKTKRNFTNITIYFY